MPGAYWRQFAASPGFAQRQAAWRQIETQLLDHAHLIKVADLAAVRA